MNIQIVLFDLDGTLLPMEQDVFTKTYFNKLATKLAKYSYDSKQLIETIWAGTVAMIKNNGKKSNADIFWEVFELIYGEKAKKDISLFEEFYKNEFDDIRSICGYNQKAINLISKLKNHGIRIALATNPIFPSIATEKRINWAGLKLTDFELYTSYENSNYCKPNLNYYKNLAKQLDVKPKQCLMVGNDVCDDMIAKKIGMNVFLLTDCLINKKNNDITSFPNGNFVELEKYLSKFLL